VNVDHNGKPVHEVGPADTAFDSVSGSPAFREWGQGDAMKLEGENVLLRIFVDTFLKWHWRPVYEVLVERARREGLAGATVVAGIEGFGQAGELLKDRPWSLKNDREVIVEIVDTEEAIAKFLEEVEPMLKDAIVTTERAHVVFYRRKGETAK